MSETAFPKSARLLCAADYGKVFGTAKPVRVSIPEILIIASPNDQAPARLGLVVAKKHLRLAVHRNRYKRVIRDSFRLRRRELAGFDIVVLIRKGAKNLDRANLHPLMNKLWSQLAKKAQP